MDSYISKYGNPTGYSKIRIQKYLDSKWSDSEFQLKIIAKLLFFNKLRRMANIQIEIGGNYMKKISRLITTVLVLCMAFSTVAFAAETTSITEVNDAQAYFNDKAGEPGIQSREPAPPITSATITDILLDDSNGHVYAIVQVAGYGSAYGYIDGTRVTLADSATIGSPVVTGFIYLFDCGVLSSGSHTFRYSGTSYNSPWNTVSTQITFQVP